MGRKKKKTYEKQDQTAAEYRFFGGPLDGSTRRYVFPPVQHVRTALPEWCTYEYQQDLSEDAGGIYRYIGDVRILKDIGDTYHS